MDTLMPCPHCGAAPRRGVGGQVFCIECRASAPDVMTWNTRTFLGAGNVSSESSESMPADPSRGINSEGASIHKLPRKRP